MQAKNHTLTAFQLRAARGALNLSVKQVSDATGIGTATIVRYEAADGVPRSRKGHLETLRTYFTGQGIAFIGTPTDRPGIEQADKGEAHD